MNHAGFDRRLDFIKSTIVRELGLEPRKIEPVQYDPDCEFPYNNFVYRIELPITQDFHDKRKPGRLTPGTTRLPTDVSTFVIRLSNAMAGLNDANRVENEVAAMSLFGDALSDAFPQLVPKVYGWGSAAEGQGWILQEYMAGENRAFKKMTTKDKESTVLQMAEIFGALQRFKIPDTVKNYGGLRFDEDGTIVSAPMTLISGGPFQTYEELWDAILHSTLAMADESTILEGWRPNGVRERLENFLVRGIPRLIRQVHSRRRVLVHGDFTSDNLLFDPETLRITGILDFDWSYIGSTADEFLRSFGDICGKFPSSQDQEADMNALHIALLQKFPEPLPSSDSSVLWEVAKIWDDELERMNLERPRTIQGIAAVSEVFWLSEQICPFLLCNPTVLKYRTSQQQKQDRESAEKLLVKFLEAHAF